MKPSVAVAKQAQAAEATAAAQIEIKEHLARIEAKLDSLLGTQQPADAKAEKPKKN